MNRKDLPTPRAPRGCGLWGLLAPGPLHDTCKAGAHLGIAASYLDQPVADGQEQLHHAVGAPILGLHQGLAQGQPHVAGQEVLAVLPGGPASPRGCPQLCAAPVAAHWFLTRLRSLRGWPPPQPGAPDSVPHTVGALIRWADGGQATRDGREQGSQLSPMALWPRAGALTPGLSLLICRMGVAELASQGKQVKAGSGAGAAPGPNEQLGQASSSQGPQEVASLGHEGWGPQAMAKAPGGGAGQMAMGVTLPWAAGTNHQGSWSPVVALHSGDGWPHPWWPVLCLPGLSGPL